MLFLLASKHFGKQTSQPEANLFVNLFCTELSLVHILASGTDNLTDMQEDLFPKHTLHHSPMLTLLSSPTAQKPPEQV